MVAIGNPIIGPLHPKGWVRPAGNTDMVVTQTAAEHMRAYTGHPAGPPALDIGDGAPDLDSILAPHAGTVSQALTVGSANLSIDFTSGGKRWRIVLAHDTLPHLVAVGQSVSEGQVVDRMGMTGATAIHLHIQLGWWNGTAWVWVDPWLYLRQNGATEEEDVDVLKGINPVRIVNRKTNVIGDNTRFRPSPGTADPPLTEYPAGTLFYPDYLVQGGLANGSRGWYAGWGTTPKGAEFGYMSDTVVNPLSPIEQSGHSDDELSTAAHAAAVDVSGAAATAAAKYPAA
jgi:murein DD-endopeptidase MepM/ murein hydrolase activator NlpD